MRDGLGALAARYATHRPLGEVTLVVAGAADGGAEDLDDDALLGTRAAPDRRGAVDARCGARARRDDRPTAPRRLQADHVGPRGEWRATAYCGARCARMYAGAASRGVGVVVCAVASVGVDTIVCLARKAKAPPARRTNGCRTGGAARRRSSRRRPATNRRRSSSPVMRARRAPARGAAARVHDARSHGRAARAWASQLGWNKIDDVSVGDAFDMRLEPFGQYILPNRAVGVYGHLPIGAPVRPQRRRRDRHRQPGAGRLLPADAQLRADRARRDCAADRAPTA